MEVPELASRSTDQAGARSSSANDQRRATGCDALVSKLAVRFASQQFHEGSIELLDSAAMDAASHSRRLKQHQGRGQAKAPAQFIASRWPFSLFGRWTAAPTAAAPKRRAAPRREARWGQLPLPHTCEEAGGAEAGRAADSKPAGQQQQRQQPVGPGTPDRTASQQVLQRLRSYGSHDSLAGGGSRDVQALPSPSAARLLLKKQQSGAAEEFSSQPREQQQQQQGKQEQCPEPQLRTSLVAHPISAGFGGSWAGSSASSTASAEEQQLDSTQAGRDQHTKLGAALAAASPFGLDPMDSGVAAGAGKPQPETEPASFSLKRCHSHVELPSSGGHSRSGSGAEQEQEEPYRLRAVGHSLGGMSLLIHCVLRGNAAAGAAVPAGARGPGSSPRPGSSHVHRLILLTPAGFHIKKPLVADLMCAVLPLTVRISRFFWPRFAFPFYLPTSLARRLVFKLFRDVYSIPSLLEIFYWFVRVALNNDASQWERAMQMPHYNAEDMPAMSAYQVLHLCQISHANCFQLFDYGSPKANRAAYGTPRPPDVAAQYGRLGHIPVDLVAGLRDGVIPPENIRMHHAKMQEAGVKVTYKEFDFGHLDFTFAVKEDLKMYMMRLLRKQTT